MCSPFSCSSFQDQELYDFDELFTPFTSPNRSKSSRNYSKRRDSKNPYANQGLDKFNALLAELEDKKKKIYTQKGSQDISFVYFTDSKSDDWEPIIVKVKKKEDKNTKNSAKYKRMMTSSEAEVKHTIEASRTLDEAVRQPEEDLIRKPKTESNKWSLIFKNWRQIFGYLPLTIFFILLFLTMYGRSFAILCTTLGWYLIPMMTDQKNSSSVDRPKKKNEHYARRLSEKNIMNVDDGSAPSSPKSVLGGPAEIPLGRHAYRKSW